MLTLAGKREGSEPLSTLLRGSGTGTLAGHGHQGTTEELLGGQLYPGVSPEEFPHFMAKMRGILKSVASADMDFNQREAFLTAQTKKQDSGLWGLSWRVDGKSQSRHSDQMYTALAVMGLEMGQSGMESEFLCLAFDLPS
ncbi:hypothetical protein GH733_006166 [Mirounga leonina]|nr:hypothetical protein GH733_006166 [Mirounga leonina]